MIPRFEQLICLLGTTDAGTSGSNLPVWPREISLRALDGNAERLKGAPNRTDSSDADVGHAGAFKAMDSAIALGHPSLSYRKHIYLRQAGNPRRKFRCA